MESCRLCRNANMSPILELGSHPIAHRFLNDPSVKEYVHPIALELCEECGLIQLKEPVDPKLLYSEYFCLSSWKWQPHMSRLAELVNELPGLDKSAKVLEIGCNDGGFLQVLKELGFENVMGVEPAQDAVDLAKQRNLNVIGTYFNKEVAKDILSSFGQVDFLVSRQMLEHITDLDEMKEAMRMVLKPGGLLFIEVPNFEFNLSVADYSGIWEEHSNYFTKDSLSKFMADIGVEMTHWETANFSGDALIAFGRSVEGAVEGAVEVHAEQYLPTLRKKVLAYKEHWPIFKSSFSNYLKEHNDQGGKVSVFGAGCRACSLINYTQLTPYIDCFIDDQPEKQGKFMPGSKLPVYPSDALKERGIDLCLLAVNAENDEKVMAKHEAFQQRGGKFIPILPPSQNLLPFWSLADAYEKV